MAMITTKFLAPRSSSLGIARSSASIYSHFRIPLRTLPIPLSAAGQRTLKTTSQRNGHCKHQKDASGCGTAPTSQTPPPPPPSALTASFWTSRPTWRRAGVNTFRCLVGCTTGDFSAMWYLQAYHPDMGMQGIMAISMATGLATSMLLETVLLRYGRDGLSWPMAARTAAGMSMISMITMELAENAVDYHLTGGVVQLDSPSFWAAALLSLAAGFLTPLPYNYFRLRKHGKACH